MLKYYKKENGTSICYLNRLIHYGSGGGGGSGGVHLGQIISPSQRQKQSTLTYVNHLS